ncbi:MAG: DUF2721 domain-containing protein [Firmicutes bacterium]|jgi:hypothetical protein|nr:DUF2721 domain-containing protein [Bacillota bacterium]NLO66600.1 DUF2721 domain-containing protein [Bacillota bacterium]
MELTTPALLFPAISLLMLAYTNRFVVLAGLVRELYAEYEEEQNEIIARQIENLQTRITVIKYMQIFGALSFFFCVVCMFLLFAGSTILANVVFSLSLILLLISLALLVRELQLSIDALDAHLSDFPGAKS